MSEFNEPQDDELESELERTRHKLLNNMSELEQKRTELLESRREIRTLILQGIGLAQESGDVSSLGLVTEMLNALWADMRGEELCMLSAIEICLDQVNEIDSASELRSLIEAAECRSEELGTLDRFLCNGQPGRASIVATVAD